MLTTKTNASANNGTSRTTRGERRATRLIATALIALGLAGGGSLGLTAVAYADSAGAQNGTTAPVKPDRGAKNPSVSSPGLTQSALGKAQKLQNPGHPLAHLGLAVD